MNKTNFNPYMRGLQQVIGMNISTSQHGTSVDPSVFGPPMWFTFHNAATMYPKNPTDFVKHSMKQLLSSSPLLVVCLTCKEHFYNFLRNYNLDFAVASRDNLFKFWVDAHNYVNRQLGKRQWTLQEAKTFYGFDKPGVGSSVRITYTGIVP